MIDSHTHLHVCKPDDAELVASAVAAGVERMLTVGTNGATCREALRSAERFPQVFAAVGRHPNEATGFDAADAAELQALAEALRVVAVLLHPWMPESSGKLLDALGSPQLELDAARMQVGRLGAIAKLEPLFPKPQA